MLPLRQSTDGQVILLARAVDSTDGNTEETALTIANTDIKIWKHNATAAVNKNSGGATHAANGDYYCTLDATDSNTAGRFTALVHVAGMLYLKSEFVVLPQKIYDSFIAGTDNVEVDTVQISGDSAAADNAESFFDGTGYAGANNTIPTVTSLTNAPSDSSGITTLLSRITAAVALASDMSTLLTRLSAARAGYLDNLSAGAAALQSSVDDLEGRLTATRAGYLDNLSGGAVALASALSAVSGLVDDLESRLTAARAGYLDNLSAGAVAQASALSTVAGYLDTEIATVLENTGTTIPGLISALNNLSSAQAQSAAAAAISAYDPPTKAELDSAVSPLATASALAMVDGNVDSILEDTGTTIPAQISGLNNLSSAQVTTAVDTALGTAVSEPTGISDKSVKGLLWHLFARFYHKNTQTASAQTTYKANGTTVLATRTASDDGTTQTLGAAE